MKKLNTLIVILIFAELIFLAIFFFDFSPVKAVKMKWKTKDIVEYDRVSSIPVLLYHNIVEDNKPVKSPFALKKENLLNHFNIIKDQGIKVIPLSELAGGSAGSISDQKKSVVITFDDDYLSMYRILLPIVKEYKYPVTLFVYTDGISKPGKGGLDWKMLREMDKNGIDIQCHSISHRDLTVVKTNETYSSGKILYEELYVSKALMEKNLDKTISFFAFPYGRYNLELLELAKQAGYKKVFSTDYGPNIITRDNFCLRRHHIKNSYSDEFFISIIK
ncbi:MAG: polysaccharide deacetylase family protein [Spirochaetota bacterium]